MPRQWQRHRHGWLFQANKALAFLKKVAALAGKASSEVAAVAKLADGYDNFRLGIKLTK